MITSQEVSQLKQRNFDPNTVNGEFDLVEMWCTFRKERIIAGILAGITAGLIMVFFGMIVCAIKGADIAMPAKIGALPWLGNEALRFGSAKAVLIGLTSHLTFSAFLGAVYAHFTGVNKTGTLFGVGLTWGLFGWIFINNLMAPSFRPYLVANLPHGIMLFAWIVFGLSLMSVAFFDRLLSR